MGTVLIPLTQGKFAAIDAEDAVRVSAYKWHAWKHPKSHLWYARHTLFAGGEYGQWRLHRFILDAAPDAIIDHIDGDGLNCTRANLRGATNSQNGANHRLNSNNTSGYAGVSAAPTGRWKSAITVERETRVLGYYDTAEEAAHAYDWAAYKAFGAFARLNFPGQPVSPPHDPTIGLLSRQEVADRLGLNIRSLDYHVKTGHLPVALYATQRRSYFRPEDVEKVRRNHRRP